MKILIIFSILFFSISHYVHAGIAGVVLLSKGETFATNPQGTQRTLKRRSKILEGDTLSTSANGKLQIRFIDKALLTLKANSKLDVSAYQISKAKGESEEVIMNLITGGFRTITGSIGKGDKSAYTVKTPAASIGIRGTNYEVAQEKDGDFVIAVWDGGITVTNEQGSIDVGSNSEFNFVRVNPKEEPKGLEEQPEALNDPAVTETDDQKESSQEEKEESSETAKDNTNKNTDSENEKSESDESTATEETTKMDSDNVIASVDTDNVTETSDASSASTDNAKDSELENELEQAEQSAAALAEEPFPELTIVPTVDDRFDDDQYSQLLQRPRAGLLVNVQASQSGNIENPLVVADELNNQVISLPGSNPGTELNLDTFTLDTSITGNTKFDSAVEQSEYVSWGKWNGNVDVSSDPNNANNVISTAKDFYWISAEAANLSSLRGEVTFSGSEGIGDINGTPIDTLSGGFDVNFANGAIENGALDFSNNDQSWNVDFSGSVTGVNATMNNIQGSILGTGTCLDCVSGDIQGIFARPGDHFVGGFTLESTGADTANGLFSLKGTAAP